MPAVAPAKRPARRPRFEERSPELARVAATLYANTNSLKATQRLTGIPRQTVKAMLTRSPNDFLTPEKHHARNLLTFADKMLTRSNKLSDKATFMQAVTASAIAVDKYAVLQGKGITSGGGITVNVQVLTSQIDSANQLADRLAALEKTLQEKPVTTLQVVSDESSLSDNHATSNPIPATILPKPKRIKA